MKNKYVVVVQCHIVKERCSGYICEKTFHDKQDAFSDYDKSNTRFLSLTCGGCCGRAVHRKLSDLIKMIKRKEGASKEKIIVHLSSCIVYDNYHGPQCPNIEYLKNIITEKLELKLIEGSYISKAAQKKREAGVYSK